MSSQLKIPPNESDHFRGSLDAPVIVVEYADFECPYCRSANSAIEELISELGSSLCFVFRHFPLRSSHPNAELAAVAAEAADLQGQFWPMHHLLYDNQEDISLTTVKEMAQALDLDMERFEQEIHRPDLLERVLADFRGGVRSGVNGTPSFYINGLKYEGPVSLGAVGDQIDGILHGRRHSHLRSVRL
jgi:protein-disulfide isomerase